MSYHLTSLGSQAVLEPERAARTLAALFKRFDGRTVDVAEYLGVSTSTVKRWVAMLELRLDIERERKSRRGGG